MSRNSSGNQPQDLKFYGRRKGKKLHARRLSAYEEVLPEIEIKLPLPPLPLSLSSLFSFPTRDVWLEIGFGDGKEILRQAQNNPDIGMIGCEPFINGIAALCADIRDQNIRNIRIWPDDARLLLPRLGDNSIGKCFLLNSDPWPKKRHHKRRFIQKETLDELHRILKPGAELVMSTDDPSLAVWELEKTYFYQGFEWQAACAADWRERPGDMLETRYQQKGLKQGRNTFFLRFRKKI